MPRGAGPWRRVGSAPTFGERARGRAGGSALGSDFAYFDCHATCPAARVLVWRTAYLWRRCQRVFLSILRCLCLLIFFRRFLTTEPMKPPDRTRNREQGLVSEPLVPRSSFLAVRFLLRLEFQKCYFGRNAIVSGLHRHVYPGVFRRAVDEVCRDARSFL